MGSIRSVFKYPWVRVCCGALIGIGSLWLLLGPLNPVPVSVTTVERSTLLARWFAAIGTVSAVLVALFKDAVLRLVNRPQLSVEILRDDWDFNPAAGEENAARFYNVRGWVNNHGSVRAEKVQLQVSRLALIGPDGRPVPQGILRMNLVWCHPTKWRDIVIPADPPDPGPAGRVMGVGYLFRRGARHEERPVFDVFHDGISPETGAQFDLAVIARSEEGPDQTAVVLRTEASPPSGSNVLTRPGEYRLHLKIAAANAKPVEVEIRIWFDGQWSSSFDQMFPAHATITVVRDGS